MSEKSQKGKIAQKQFKRGDSKKPAPKGSQSKTGDIKKK